MKRCNNNNHVLTEQSAKEKRRPKEAVNVITRFNDGKRLENEISGETKIAKICNAVHAKGHTSCKIFPRTFYVQYIICSGINTYTCH